MKAKSVKKVLSLIMSLIMVLGVVGYMGGTTAMAEGTEVSVGDILKFGKFNNDDIEWIIIDLNTSDTAVERDSYDVMDGNGVSIVGSKITVEPGTVVLLSKYVLEDYTWNSGVEAQWQNTQLCRYLNGTASGNFYNDSFNDNEKAVIKNYDGVTAGYYVSLPTYPEVYSWWEVGDWRKIPGGQTKKIPDTGSSDPNADWRVLGAVAGTGGIGDVNTTFYEASSGQVYYIDNGFTTGLRPVIKLDLDDYLAYVNGNVVEPTDPEVMGISIKTPPIKTTYFADDALDLAGLAVTITYKGGVSEDVGLSALVSKGITVTPANGANLTTADTKVTVEHTASGLTADIPITVTEEQAGNIGIGDIVKFGVLNGAQFGTAQGQDILWKVVGTDNDTVTLLSVYALMMRAFHSGWVADFPWKGSTSYNYLNGTGSSDFYGNVFNAGEKSAIIPYDGSAGYNVHMPTLAEARQWEPNRLDRIIKLVYDIYGNTVNWLLSDNVSAQGWVRFIYGVQPSWSSDPSWLGQDAYESNSVTAMGIRPVVKVDRSYAFEAGEIKPPADLSSMVLKTAPAKTDYIEGERLNLSGLAVTLIYEDGATADVPFASFTARDITAAPANNTVLAVTNDKVTIRHAGTGFSFDIPITVSEKPAVASIELRKAPEKTTYFAGEQLDLYGLVVRLIYADATWDDVALANYSAEGLTAAPADRDKLTAADTTITVTHTESGKSIDIPITVIDKPDYGTIPGKAEVGNYVYMGYYEGLYVDMPILWRVMSVNTANNQAILMSEYVLHEMYAHPIAGQGDLGNTNWDISLARQYLNGSFYDNSFNYLEKMAIVPYGGGISDYISMPATTEVNAWFNSNETRAASEIASGINQTYMLRRSSADFLNYQPLVNASGATGYSGWPTFVNLFLRPVIRVDLTADFFAESFDYEIEVMKDGSPETGMNISISRPGSPIALRTGRTDYGGKAYFSLPSGPFEVKVLDAAMGVIKAETIMVSGNGSCTIDLSGMVTSSVDKVTVSPASIDVETDHDQQFTANVTVAGNATSTVTWTVEGKTSANTIISSSGLLSIGADETATTITVMATSTFDNTKFAAATITVKAKIPENTITVNGVNLEYTEQNGIIGLKPTLSQMTEILKTDYIEIIFDIRGTGINSLDMVVDAGWFKDIDKTFTFITDNGNCSVKTKSLWNNSGKQRLITVCGDKVKF